MSLTRRQKRIIQSIAIGAIAVVLAAAAVWVRRSKTPYAPGEEIDGLTSNLARNLPADTPRVRFVDVTEASGIRFRHFQGTRSTQLSEDMGSGAAWGDVDGDGLLDLFIVNEAGPLTEDPSLSLATHALYRNLGNGRFDDVSESSGLAGRSYGQAAAFGDVDDDGDLDLVVTSYLGLHLYLNDGEGHFGDVSDISGIGRTDGFWSGASWSDYDRDGDLDLYVCGYVQYTYRPEDAANLTTQYSSPTPATLNPSTYKPERNLLFRNRGNGTFEEVAEAAGVANREGRSLSATWCDFDEDGWADLYVANDVSDNVMYRNRGDGSFDDISHAAWVADYRGAMGLAAGDWDSDGDMDLFVTHWIAQENALYTNLSRELAGVGAEEVFRFSDVADQVGLGQIALDVVGWGTAFTDYDGDGRPDLLVVNGSTLQRNDDPSKLVPMRPQLFWNRSNDEGFFEVGAVSGEVFGEALVGRGLAIGDYDNDGDEDAFVIVHGGRARLLMNDGGNRNRWLKVRLSGNRSNRFGIGARLTVSADSLRITREVGAGSSYGSQHAVGEAVFGLGMRTTVDSLVVLWPSGTRQVIAGPAIDSLVEVTEVP